MTERSLSRFVAARRRYIAGQYTNLNPVQREAVLTTQGPLLLLAGAGSGKTTVLIHRIANLIRFGCASDSVLVPDTVTQEDVEFLEALAEPLSASDRARADALCAVEPVEPWNILAITFTNKAANELKERLTDMLGARGGDVWAMTFHAACCRILRRNAELVGLTRHFTIYDTADSERIMKDIVKQMGLDEKTFPAKYVLAVIGREKDRLVSPQEMLERAEEDGDIRAKHTAKAYRLYQQRLAENDAVDFDDIILHTVRLLQDHEQVRTYYQRKFRYCLVDEYQDTNHLQYLLMRLLAGGYENLCVVGDDDQSIYRFRGATIENILNFEKQYPACRVIRLEQNYRSTQSILNAANAVIAHNAGRKGKRLWTDNGVGDPVTVFEAADQNAEASFVAGRILADRAKNIGLNRHAVLYRTNAQSNALEYAMKRNGIAYRIFGGTRFFDRAEIKDMLAYLCVINNRADDLRLMRIINNPPRGIGAKTIETAQRLAEAEGKPLYTLAADPYSYAPLEKSAQKLLQFAALIEELAAMLDTGISLPDFYDILLERSGYALMLQNKKTEESLTRLENVRELRSSIVTYAENAETPTLAGFLEEIALYTDIEQYNESDDAVVMMTMHAAKGLEFSHVFLVGFEDGLFPGMRAIGDREEMEEERRLCYVAITRAKQTLTISYARERMLYGRTSAAVCSRFLREIPEELLVRKGGFLRATMPSHGQATRSRGELSGATMRATQGAHPASAPRLELKQGDMVQHHAFGRGMVLSVLSMGGDALLEVAFDQVGTRRLMLKAASAYMKKL